jgi:hypothetical protein
MSEKKECCICHRQFVPNPKLKERQKTCGVKSCRKEWKRRLNKIWREQNPNYFKGRYETELKEWHEKNGNYYKKDYRKQNPDYVKKNLLYLKGHRKRTRELRLHEK